MAYALYRKKKPSRRWLLPLVGALLAAGFLGRHLSLCSTRARRSNPTFHEITFRNGIIWDARFAPDGQTIIYGAAWDGRPQEIFSTRFDSSDSRSVGLPPAQILAISSKGEMAISLHPINATPFTQAGTLARVPLAGGAPREVIENVTLGRLDTRRPVSRRHPSHILPAPHIWNFPPALCSIEPKGWVSHVRFSPNGNYIAIGDHVPGGDDGRVIVLDSHGNRKVSSSFYSSVEGVAWAPSGDEVWFSAVPAGSARSIYALDLSGKERLIYRSPGGLTIHDISRTGLVLLTADKARLGISALPPGSTRERSLSWFDWSLLADMSPDGKTIIFSETGEAAAGNYSMFLRKTDGSAAVRLGEGGFGALSRTDNGLSPPLVRPVNWFCFPPESANPARSPTTKVNHYNCAWMPDSKSIIYSAAEPGARPAHLPS